MNSPALHYPDWILERSFGGMGAAVSPLAQGMGGMWPDGRVAPMAGAACSRLVETCNSDVRTTVPGFVFLVGGAGNGKSKIAGDTVRQILGKRVTNDSPFAQRCYDYDLDNGGRFRIVNDATIPPDKQNDKPALGEDVSFALEASACLLVCVNRGVLISETSLKGTLDSIEDAAGRLISSWLLDAEYTSQTFDGVAARLAVSPQENTAHYAFARLLIDDVERAFIHVVFMDQASLLELWPDTPNQKSDRGQPLEAAKLLQRPIASRNHSSGPESEFATPLSRFAQEYAHKLPFDDLDPVLANASSLSSIASASAWCAVLRGAEIASGTNFTYRELWALASHSIIGPCSASELGRLRVWVQERQRIARGSDSDAAAEALVSISALRSHMLLFDAGRANSNGCPIDNFIWASTTSDALQSVLLSDPLRDFGPNNGVEYTNLLDGIAAIEEGARPGQALAENDELVGAYWTRFDSQFENAVAKLVSPDRDGATLRQRNVLLDWYGKYLFRLVAISRGWPAHFTLINTWQNAWRHANDTGRLPNNLERAFRDIILPKVGDEEESFFPLLKSRVDMPASGETSLSVGISRGDFRILVSTFGDNMAITLCDNTRDQEPIAETVLDFHLVREALAKQGGHGFSDSLSLIEPRVERIRAGLLSAQTGKTDIALRYRAFLDGRSTEFIR